MPTRKNRIPVKGSERALLPRSKPVGAPQPQERIEVTVVVRRRKAGQPADLIQSRIGHALNERTYLTHKELSNSYGAAPADLNAVKAFARSHGLKVVQSDAARRSVVLSGTAKALGTAFGVDLMNYQTPEFTYRGRRGPVHVPAELESIVEGVFGLDDRPTAKPHCRRLEKPAGLARSRAAGAGFTPMQIAKMYDFPTGVDGKGQCIALIELGGGFRKSDLKAYFSDLGIPAPKVTAISVDRARNAPSGPAGADGEVMLDIEVAGAVAPGARIAVYFAPNTDRGFLDAITKAIHDSRRKPSVISISWGAPETGFSDSSWTPQAMRAFDQAFQDAAAVGVTVFCASGDDGSSDGVVDGLAHCDFPASSPFVAACGGTRLVGSNGKIGQEAVWNDGGGATGGGISEIFDLPSYQANANVPKSTNPGGVKGRGVPDVAGNASPATGYQVRVDGQDFVMGGTSAVAPLWAGLIARINQKLGNRVGFINPLLYGLPGKAFRDITHGDNGAYGARHGWDACTGLGSPIGSKLLKELSVQARTGRKSRARARGVTAPHAVAEA